MSTTTTRTTVRVICRDGWTWLAAINGTLADAEAYFVGVTFTEEDVETGRETRHVVERVELQA